MKLNYKIFIIILLIKNKYQDKDINKGKY